MDVQGWDERYRSRERRAEDLDASATSLVIDTASKLKADRALDLACGTGRNAIWLAQHGWKVTAVDGSSSAIAVLRERASDKNVEVDSHVADLRKPGFVIEPNAFELVVICYYLQRDLFESAKAGVKPGGVLLAIVHTTEGDEQPTEHRLGPGQLSGYLKDWEILHSYEGSPKDAAHRRAVAEIVVRKPM